MHATPLPPEHDQVRDAIAEIRLEFPPSLEIEDDDSSGVGDDVKRNTSHNGKTNHYDTDDDTDDADDKDKVCDYRAPRVPRARSLSPVFCHPGSMIVGLYCLAEVVQPQTLPKCAKYCPDWFVVRTQCVVS